MKKDVKALREKFGHLDRMDVQYLDIEQIKPNRWNPNRQSDGEFELLLRSMEDDGFTQPIILIPDPDGTTQYVVVDGEHRWRAAQALGFTKVPGIITNMTLEQAMISTVRHNRARGQHAVENEAAILSDLAAAGILDLAQDALMLSGMEVERMMSDLPGMVSEAEQAPADAWLPEDLTSDERELVVEGVSHVTEVSAGGMVIRETTAIEAVREREQLIARVKAAEDARRSLAEADIFRISLLFTDQEAVVIRSVLEPQPSQRLLEICRASL